MIHQIQTLPRPIKLKLLNFEDFGCQQVIKNRGLSKACFTECFQLITLPAHNTSHIVFDSYIEGLIKGPKRAEIEGQEVVRFISLLLLESHLYRIKLKCWKSVVNTIGFQDYAKSEFTEPNRQNKVKLVMGELITQ